MSENEHIPVFFASDDNYAKLVAATAVSILENTKSFVDFTKEFLINSQKG